MSVRSLVVSRRRLLVAAGVASVGLSVGFYFGVRNFPILPSSQDPKDDDGRHWLHMTPDGKVMFLSPVHDLGQGTPSSLALVVAEELNLEVGDVKVVVPDTSGVPYMRFTTGSHGVSSHVRPVAFAAAVMREVLRQRAADHFGVPAQAIQDALHGFRSGEMTIDHASLLGEEGQYVKAEDFADVPLYSFAMERPRREVGRSTRDVKDLEIVTGAALFADDLRLPGMLYGRTVQPPFPGAGIRDANLERARGIPGVVEVVLDKAEALVGAIAATPSVLDRALAALEVTWDLPPALGDAELRSLVDVDAFLAKGGLEHLIEDGDVRRDGRWTVDHRLDLPPLHHAAEELRTAIAHFGSANGEERLELWVGTQDVFVHRRKAARDLGWSEDRVIVHPIRTGGAFGGRALYDVGREAVLLARYVDRPVKVRWTREDEFQVDRVRAPSSHRVRIRADEAGRISDLWHASVSGHFLLTEIMAPAWALDIASLAIADFGATRSIRFPYCAPHRRIEFQDEKLPFPVGQWRSLGATQNTAAVEIAMDRLSQRTGIEPIALRLLNLDAEQERLKGCLTRLRDLIDANPRSDGAARGVACGIYHDHSFVAAAFDVVRSADGPIRVQTAFCVLDVGVVLNPDRVRAQIEGCIMMAIGQVLMEQAHLVNGTLSARSFRDYSTPSYRHVPEMQIDIVDSFAAPAGAGEAPLIAAVPALANAVGRLCGKHVTQLPLVDDDRVPWRGIAD